MLPELKRSPGCQREISAKCKGSALLDRSRNETTSGGTGLHAPGNPAKGLYFSGRGRPCSGRAT